jgi:hypothetical protein
MFIKKATITLEYLKRALSLPENVQIVTVCHNLENGWIQMAIADPAEELPEEGIFDEDTKKWKTCSNKGNTGADPYPISDR